MKHIPTVVAALALVLAGCAGAQASSGVQHPATSTEECFLGLDLWDTDPALTWIAESRVWVRTGDRQACLTTTSAAEIWWSPDGRSLFLDEHLVAGETVVGSNSATDPRQTVWHHPHGDGLFVVNGDGTVGSFDPASGTSTPIRVPSDVRMIASHPDAAHLATVDGSGVVRLVSLDTGAAATVLALSPSEEPIQLEFSADGSRLWVMTGEDGVATARFVDLVSISDFLDIPEVESMVPSSVPAQPQPDLYFLAVDLAEGTPALGTGIGASGVGATRFVLHPTHPDWIVITQGSCADATSSLFIDGVVKAEGIPGAAVGFFRGHGIPILATSTGGGECGTGELWVTSGLPLQNTPELVADGVLSADIRDEAPDAWNPNTAPPFA